MQRKRSLFLLTLGKCACRRTTYQDMQLRTIDRFKRMLFCLHSLGVFAACSRAKLDLGIFYTLIVLTETLFCVVATELQDCWVSFFYFIAYIARTCPFGLLLFSESWSEAVACALACAVWVAFPLPLAYEATAFLGLALLLTILALIGEGGWVNMARPIIPLATMLLAWRAESLDWSLAKLSWSSA